MLSLSYENINYVMTQILKLSCASFSYVNISYVPAIKGEHITHLHTSDIVTFETDITDT